MQIPEFYLVSVRVLSCIFFLFFLVLCIFGQTTTTSLSMMTSSILSNFLIIANTFDDLSLCKFRCDWFTNNEDRSGVADAPSLPPPPPPISKHVKRRPVRSGLK